MRLRLERTGPAISGNDLQGRPPPPIPIATTQKSTFPLSLQQRICPRFMRSPLSLRRGPVASLLRSRITLLSHSKMAIESNHGYVEPFLKKFPPPSMRLIAPAVQYSSTVLQSKVYGCGTEFQTSECEPESLQLAGPCCFQKLASARKSDCL